MDGTRLDIYKKYRSYVFKPVIKYEVKHHATPIHYCWINEIYFYDSILKYFWFHFVWDTIHEFIDIKLLLTGKKKLMEINRLDESKWNFGMLFHNGELIFTQVFDLKDLVQKEDGEENSITFSSPVKAFLNFYRDMMLPKNVCQNYDEILL